MPDLHRLLGDAPEPDALARQAVAQRATRSLRPPGSLARLDEVAAWLAGWQRTDCPAVDKPFVLLAAGDHGVVARGVSTWDPTVTRAVVDAVRAGVATSTVMAERVGATLRLVDAGIGEPSADITTSPGLTPGRFERLFQLGRDQVSELDADLIALGEMGVGNTTAAAAICTALYGGDAASWVGPGAGIDEQGMERKLAAVESAVSRVAGAAPLELLGQLGGPELAVLAGACVEARRRSVPVLLDGFVVGAAVAPLEAARPGALDHCLAAHVSAEPGHARLLERLGKRPLIDLGMRLGEGTGAIAAIPLVRLAAAAVVDVVTFDEWGM